MGSGNQREFDHLYRFWTGLDCTHRRVSTLLRRGGRGGLRDWSVSRPLQARVDRSTRRHPNGRWPDGSNPAGGGELTLAVVGDPGTGVGPGRGEIALSGDDPAVASGFLRGVQGHVGHTDQLVRVGLLHQTITPSRRTQPQPASRRGTHPRTSRRPCAPTVTRTGGGTTRSPVAATRPTWSS